MKQVNETSLILSYSTGGRDRNLNSQQRWDTRLPPTKQALKQALIAKGGEESQFIRLQLTDRSYLIM